MISKYKFDKHDADYFQFHLKDAETNETLEDAWTDEALVKNLAVSNQIIGVGTKRNTTVRITIEVFKSEPTFEPQNKWRQNLESEINLPSGKLILTSPTLEKSSQEIIQLTPGSYFLRVYFGDGNSRGVHSYKLDFWRKD